MSPCSISVTPDSMCGTMTSRQGLRAHGLPRVWGYSCLHIAHTHLAARRRKSRHGGVANGCPKDRSTVTAAYGAGIGGRVQLRRRADRLLIETATGPLATSTLWTNKSRAGKAGSHDRAARSTAARLRGDYCPNTPFHRKLGTCDPRLTP